MMEEQWLRCVGERLEDLRSGSYLSEGELGAILGIPGNRIRFYEIGYNQMSITVLGKYCNYFDVTADYLLFGKM